MLLQWVKQKGILLETYLKAIDLQEGLGDWIDLTQIETGLEERVRKDVIQRLTTFRSHS